MKITDLISNSRSRKRRVRYSIRVKEKLLLASRTRPKPPRRLPIVDNFLWERDSASSVKALTQGLRNVVILLERFCTRACAFTPTRKQRKLICIGHRSNERSLPLTLSPSDPTPLRSREIRFEIDVVPIGIPVSFDRRSFQNYFRVKTTVSIKLYRLNLKWKKKKNRKEFLEK